MKISIILVLFSFLIGSCGQSQEEIEAEKRRYADSVRLAEQKAKEEERIRLANLRYDKTDLIGEWSVKMECTKSSCDNTKKGDVRAEKWVINFENDIVHVNVLGNRNTDDFYEGTFDGKNLILENHRYETKQGFWSSKTKKVGAAHIELKMNSKNKLSGEREVLNPGPCQIEYSVELTK